VSGPDLNSYDVIVVAFSGGKDSIACVLHLLELGVPRERLELWHHDVDGREGSRLMDWPVTRGYCRAFAAAFRLPIFFSWKVGGFEGEMCRDNARTAPTRFETPSGTREIGGTRGELGTRKLFPQVSPDLKVRWCSAYLKIDVCAAAIRNDPRFKGRRVLVVSGERAEESPSRAKYSVFEVDRADARGPVHRRHVDRWRPVHAWKETDVWAALERHRVNPHPAYRLGWGRVSCAACIFGNPDQWASLRAVSPAQFEVVESYERRWGKTIARKGSIVERADAGRPYAATADRELRRLALLDDFHEPIILEPGAWKLPAGAFGDGCGPT
jgi:3'-phosphoadenosine 5'-phosphosulfate sulfotransferase (PAPS reductase)/FAD synthetase